MKVDRSEQGHILKTMLIEKSKLPNCKLPQDTFGMI